MKYILSRDQRDLLRRIAQSRGIVALDYDGTLAPIVDVHADATMSPSTRLLFTRLCDLYPCAVISGRGRADLLNRLAGSAVKYVVGNHGIEPGPDLASYEEDIAVARRQLHAALAGCPGVEIEDKRYSLAIHYRHATRPLHARSLIQAAIAALPVRTRTIPGMVVVNVLPERALHKGQALLDAMTLEHAEIALYCGDDVTDEDVFRIDQPDRIVGVRVGLSDWSAARYFVRDQSEVDALLTHLIALRGHESQ